MSNQELLSVILRSGTKSGSVFQLSYEILSRFGGICGLGNVRMGELLAIKGLKGAKACSILACVELGKRIQNLPNKESFFVETPADLYDLIKEQMVGLCQEQFMVICLGPKGRVIACTKLFKGSVDTHIVHPRDIFREAIKNNATYIAFAHNHPSGDALPSKADTKCTQDIVLLGRELGILVFDHIIIGRNTFFSYRNAKILTP